MTRILLIGSYQPYGISNSMIRDELVERNHQLSKYELRYIGIKGGFSIKGGFNGTWDFSRQLESLSNRFKPDYIIVHTGIGFQENPLLVVLTLIKVAQKSINVKIGFQGGRDYAIRIGLSAGSYQYSLGADGGKALSILESNLAFQESAELQNIINDTFPPRD